MLADPAGMSTCTDLRYRSDADVSHRNNADVRHPHHFCLRGAIE